MLQTKKKNPSLSSQSLLPRFFPMYKSQWEMQWWWMLHHLLWWSRTESSGKAAILEKLSFPSNLIHRILQNLLSISLVFLSWPDFGLQCWYLLSASVNISLKGTHWPNYKSTTNHCLINMHEAILFTMKFLWGRGPTSWNFMNGMWSMTP